MGRKCIADSQRSRSISVTLPPHLIQRLETVTSRRSSWVKRAIESRLNDIDILLNASVKELIQPLITRATLRETLTPAQIVVLEQIYDNAD